MAATVSSVWAKPGAWALDSEEHEDELKQDLNTHTRKPDPTPPVVPATDFPSLSAAVTQKQPKKKNKGQTLSLAQFSTYSAPRPTDEPIILPTAPRERTAEELVQARGFRNYGGDREREARPGRVNRERDGPLSGPSRADEEEDWSKGKKSSFGFERDGPMGRERERDGPSRADEDDDWSKGKKSSNFGGGGFGERREKVGFFNTSRADDVDNWAAGKKFDSAPPVPERRRGMGFDYSNGPGPDSDKWVRNVENGSGGGGRPKLNLQPRTLPVNGNGSVNGSVVEGGKKGGNPFGEARPREEVLKEKGKDWKEIDEKLEAAKLKEEKSEGVFGSGRRREYGLGRASNGSGGESVRTWRKPESNSSNGAGVETVVDSSAETAENNAEVTEGTVGTEEALEVNTEEAPEADAEKAPEGN